MRFLGLLVSLRRSFLLFVAAALLCACGGADETPVSYELVPAEFFVNPQSAVDPTALPGVDDTRAYFYVFRTQSEWRAWSEQVRNKYDPRPLPSIDFSGSTLAGVYLGMRTNSCYTLSIREVVERGGLVIVRYREGKPPAGETCSPFVIYPLKLIRIQATGLPIEFTEV